MLIVGAPSDMRILQASNSATEEWKEDAVKRLVEAEAHVEVGRLQRLQLDAAVTELLKDPFCSKYYEELTGSKRPTKRTKQ